MSISLFAYEYGLFITVCNTFFDNKIWKRVFLKILKKGKKGVRTIREVRTRQKDITTYTCALLLKACL